MKALALGLVSQRGLFVVIRALRSEFSAEPWTLSAPRPQPHFPPLSPPSVSTQGFLLHNKHSPGIHLGRKSYFCHPPLPEPDRAGKANADRVSGGLPTQEMVLRLFTAGRDFPMVTSMSADSQVHFWQSFFKGDALWKAVQL